MTQASAVYTAQLIDRVSRPAQDIADALNVLTQAFNQVRDPINAVNKAFSSVATTIKKTEKPVNRVGESLRSIQYATFVTGNAIGQSMMAASRAFYALAAGATTASAAVAAFTLKSISASAEMAEIEQTFKAVYQDGFEAANDFATEFAASMSKSVRATKQGLTQFQQLFLSLGIARDQGEQLSRVLVKLSADLGAIGAGMSFNESTTKLLKALSGGPEVLETTGMAPKDDTVKAFMAQFGVEYTKLQQSEKTLAKIAFIIAAMRKSDLIGQAAKESGNWAAQVDALSAAWEAVKRQFGALALTTVIPILNAAAKATRGISEAIGNLSGKTVNAVLGLGVALGALAIAALGAAAALQVVGASALIMTGILTGAIAIFIAISSLATLLGGPIAWAIAAAAAGAALWATIIAGVITGLTAAGLLGYGATGKAPIVLLGEQAMNMFSELSESVVLFSKAMATAIGSNDWQLVWDIMKLSWNYTIDSMATYLEITLGTAINSFVDSATQAVGKLSLALASPLSFAITQAFTKVDVAEEQKKSFDEALKELLAGKGLKPTDTLLDKDFIKEYIDKQKAEIDAVFKRITEGFASSEEKEKKEKEPDLNVPSFATSNNMIAGNLSKFLFNSNDYDRQMLDELKIQSASLERLAESKGLLFN